MRWFHRHQWICDDFDSCMIWYELHCSICGKKYCGYASGLGTQPVRDWHKQGERFMPPIPAPPPQPQQAVCVHDWRYEGTDGHGSHKGEDMYYCHKCRTYEYRDD